MILSLKKKLQAHISFKSGMGRLVLGVRNPFYVFMYVSNLLSRGTFCVPSVSLR